MSTVDRLDALSLALLAYAAGSTDATYVPETAKDHYHYQHEDDTSQVISLLKIMEEMSNVALVLSSASSSAFPSSFPTSFAPTADVVCGHSSPSSTEQHADATRTSRFPSSTGTNTGVTNNAGAGLLLLPFQPNGDSPSSSEMIGVNIDERLVGRAMLPKSLSTAGDSSYGTSPAWSGGALMGRDGNGEGGEGERGAGDGLAVRSESESEFETLLSELDSKRRAQLRNVRSLADMLLN